MDHVDLPEVALRVGVLRMPLDTPVLGVEQIGVFDASDTRVAGDACHGGEAPLRTEDRGVDVEVYVAVGHQQTRAERSHEVRGGPGRSPGGFGLQFGEDGAGPPLVFGAPR